MERHQYILFVLTELLLGGLLLLYPEWPMVILFASLQIIWFTNRKAYLIADHLFPGAMWVRRTTYFVPYLAVFLFFTPLPPEPLVQHLSLIFLAVAIGVVLLAPRMKELYPLFQKEIVLLFPSCTFSKTVLEVYSLWGSAILQELYYKGVVIAILYPYVGKWVAVLISSFLFVIEHYLHFYAKDYGRKDIIAQFCMSVSSGFLYVITGSLLTAVLVHVTYNGVISVTYLYRYLVHRNEEKGGKVA
ncbi:MAG: CPBP family intramembrane metalloprotease [Brevibacillus sp.]|nr:CPBP family intramembrane metalloprotease [Brevibacillus sp.]